MKYPSRILAYIVTSTVAMACLTSASAADIYREGVFLASLEHGDLQSLPPAVTTDSRFFSKAEVSDASDRANQTQNSVAQVGAEFVGYIVDQPSASEASFETMVSFESESNSCEACPCFEEEGWLCRKSNQLNRKIYFSRQNNHKKSLYPVIRPYCQPGYGVYETCWRQFQPNSCCYRCLEPAGDPALLPAPQPASAAGQEPNQLPPNQLPRPYER